MAHAPESGLPEAVDRPWHALAADAALAALRATRDGLSTDEASRRLAHHGPNVLERKAGVSAAGLIWRQIDNPLIWVLIGSAVVALLVDPADGRRGMMI